MRAKIYAKKTSTWGKLLGERVLKTYPEDVAWFDI